MIMTLRVNKPMGQAIGIKEAIAMDLEKYGDVEVVDIRDDGAGAQTEMRLEV